ncbi:hypothetical protein H1R20_g889, partial [Candolleomyces eurysporus]
MSADQQVPQSEDDDEVDEDEDESEQSAEVAPGEDEQDYEGIDLHNAFETAQWPRGVNGGNTGGTSSHDSEDEDQNNNRGGRKSRLTKRQKQLQDAEQPFFPDHHRSASTLSTGVSEDETALEILDNDSEEAPVFNGNPDSIEIVITKGDRYPLLNQQSPRVGRVIRKAFAVSEYQIAFCTPFPPLDDLAHYFRDVLRTGAREIDDKDVARKIKTNATYGNTLATLVKPRFTRHRREIRQHAKAEAKAAYQLTPGQSCGEKVQGLLLDDTFVYGVDHRDVRSVGQTRRSSFKSSISEEENRARSEEKEIPIPMLAFSATMLRAELLLWKFGTRQTVKFDADQHSTTYDHHVSALEELKGRFPVKFHHLMHFLYVQGSASASSSVSNGCDGRGVLGKLGWDADSE